VETILLDAKADKDGIDARRVDLQRVLDEVLELLDPEIVARNAKVLCAPMPAVRGDEALLGGLFTNLITNALKYGPRSHANIEIAAEREGEYWRVSVEDDGPPIPDAERGRIFEPFQRAHRERRSRGTGLGLSICRRIVEHHGGRIGLAPQATGNCFYFTLPG
jgi:signal transduction histidine kinase